MTPTEAQIKDIIELAVDNELPAFSMDANWYTDYDMDSLGAVQLVVEVQKVFKVRLPDSKMSEIRTGNDLVAVILELQAAQSSSGSAVAAI